MLQAEKKDNIILLSSCEPKRIHCLVIMKKRTIEIQQRISSHRYSKINWYWWTKAQNGQHKKPTHTHIQIHVECKYNVTKSSTQKKWAREIKKGIELKKQDTREDKKRNAVNRITMTDYCFSRSDHDNNTKCSAHNTEFSSVSFFRLQCINCMLSIWQFCVHSVQFPSSCWIGDLHVLFFRGVVAVLDFSFIVCVPLKLPQICSVTAFFGVFT